MLIQQLDKMEPLQVNYQHKFENQNERWAKHFEKIEKWILDFPFFLDLNVLRDRKSVFNISVEE